MKFSHNLKQKKKEMSQDLIIYRQRWQESTEVSKMCCKAAPTKIFPLLYFVPTLLCSTQFLPEVTQNNIFSTFKISDSQHMYKNIAYR